MTGAHANAKTRTSTKKTKRIAKGATMSRNTSIATIAKAMPARLHRARRTIKSVGTRSMRTMRSVGSGAMRITKESPGRSLIGAFAVGFVVAKLARFV